LHTYERLNVDLTRNLPTSLPKSKIKIGPITRYFQSETDRVFTLSDLELLHLEKLREWNLPPSMTSYSFIQTLLNRTNLSEIRLRSSHYSSPRRFSWQRKASPIAVAISVKKANAYFSHASAMWIHGLSDNHKQIFINKDQSEKPKNLGQLSQEAIDRVFRNRQRHSRTNQASGIESVNISVYRY
jgi:hypothetical protein